MRIILSFILFCFILTPLHSASMDIPGVELEGRIRDWYTEYKVIAPPSTKELRRPATFVGHLHNQLLQQETEEGVDLYSRAILAVIGRGAGVGGLRAPNNEQDKSHLLTREEKAIVKSALIDAERLRRSGLDYIQDYFGPSETYFARAGRDQNYLDALSQHAKNLENIATQIYSLQVSINDPQSINDAFIKRNLIKALQHLNLSNSVMLPEIYSVRTRNGSLSNFDRFNMAFLDPAAIHEILMEWGQPRHDIPLAYFTLQGLPNCTPAELQRPFYEEIVSLSPRRLAKQLLVATNQTEEHILETIRTKSITGIRSTIILNFFLDKYLPETGGALLSQDELLHLFKILGKKVDNDPQRTEICLRGLGRLINAYPTLALETVINALISGITYSWGDQMTDFYLEAIRMVYQKALSSYSKAGVMQLLNPFFQLEFSTKDYGTLMSKCNGQKNIILTDLLTRGLLEAEDKASFASKRWVNAENIARLTE